MNTNNLKGQYRGKSLAKKLNYTENEAEAYIPKTPQHRMMIAAKYGSIRAA